MARLGDLERSVMDVLWSADDWLTARDVAARLHHERDLAYTTVLTVLERLERKGFVRRQRAARAHRYAAADSRETVVAEAMLEALGTADDRGSALVRFVGSVSAEEAEILRRALEPPAAESAGAEPIATEPTAAARTEAGAAGVESGTIPSPGSAAAAGMAAGASPSSLTGAAGDLASANGDGTSGAHAGGVDTPGAGSPRAPQTMRPPATEL